MQNTSQIGNYADYANISTYAMQTAIDPALEALGVQMAYRLAQVINLIVQNTADGAEAADAKVAMTPLGTNLTAQDITAAAQSLTASMPFPSTMGDTHGCHPSADCRETSLISTQPNRITDVLKRTARRPGASAGVAVSRW